MGKYVLLLVMAAAGVWALAQQQTTLQTAETEVEREEEVLARQAARTGLNSLLAETRTVADDNCPDQIVDSVDSRSGTYETDGYNHGTYKAWLEVAPGVDLGYRAYAKGQFPDQSGATVTLDRLIQRTENREGLVYGYGKEGNGNGKLKRTTTEGSEEFGSAPQGSAPQVRGMGPLATNLDDDGKDEVPYVRQGSAKIEMIDSESEQVQTLVNNSDAKKPATSKIRLGVGSWGGGDPSVFYANENGDAIYKVSWDPNEGGNKNQNDPEKVADLYDSGNRNEVDAVVGIANINGDGDKELIYADGSQELRYMDNPNDGDDDKGDRAPGIEFPEIPDPSADEDLDPSVGSNKGIGTGSLVDLDKDGVSSVVFIDTGNEIAIANDDGTVRRISDDGGAAKTPPTAIDLDGDDDLEIAYLRKKGDGPDVEYVNQDGSNIRPLCGISVKESTGLVSTR